MAWLICCSCHHHAEIKPLPKRRRPKCSSCGSQAVRSVRQLKTTMLNGGQTDPHEAKIMTYGGLLSIAQQRGYKQGWAAQKYRKIYGVWPKCVAAPINPSGELIWWVNKQNAAYAKMRRALEPPKPLPPPKESELMTANDWGADL